jgi:hypothetical protein
MNITDRNRSLIPVKTVRRPKAAVWVAPSPARIPTQKTADRIALEVQAELDVMVSQLKLPAGPIEVPNSGLCHKTIRESFQGYELEWFCVRRPGHADPCSPGSDDLAAAEDTAGISAGISGELDHPPTLLDHQDAWGCLDAPLAVS